MKTNNLYRELSNDPLFSYKEKKDIVLRDLEEAKAFYQRGAKLYKRLVELSYSDTNYYSEFKAKSRSYGAHLWWLKQLSKRRALKYALQYHWSFYL